MGLPAGHLDVRIDGLRRRPDLPSRVEQEPGGDHQAPPGIDDVSPSWPATACYESDSRSPRGPVAGR
ncbi:hypothetical protein [Actinoplanes philippinensis]|uniref:hypothetical protein n=1 Tax=Actinoplanes philippinensis TaxID=35752 RepID=UPI003402C62F